MYVPPGYDDHPERRYPSVYVIHGYGGCVSKRGTGRCRSYHNRWRTHIQIDWRYPMALASLASLLR